MSSNSCHWPTTPVSLRIIYALWSDNLILHLKTRTTQICCIFTTGKMQPALKRGKVKCTDMIRTFNVDKAKKRPGYRAQDIMRDCINRASKLAYGER